MFRASKKADDFIKIIENTGKTHREMKAEEFLLANVNSKIEEFNKDSVKAMAGFMEAYAKHENEALQKENIEKESRYQSVFIKQETQIAELKELLNRAYNHNTVAIDEEIEQALK